MDAPSTVDAPVVKLASVWAAVGISSWSDLASAAAFIYSLLLIADWCWKKFGRTYYRAWRKRHETR